MNQPVPNVTEADVGRVVRRDFSPGQVDAAHVLLGEYGGKDWHREVTRVRLAALKLASGNLKKLREAIRTANQDFRDVLSYAEYPGYFTTIRPEESDDARRAAAIEEDWRQYREWLERKSNPREEL